MANMIDGLKQARHQELIALTSAIETYTFSNRMGAFARQIGNLFRKLFRKSTVPAGMQVRLEQTQTELASLRTVELQERLQKDLVRELRFVKRVPKGSSEDQLSVSMLQAVSALYGKKQFAFLSPAEMADDLKVKCAKRNPNTVKRLPNLWLWCSLLLFFCAVGMAVYLRSDLPVRGIAAAALVLEAALCFLLRRKAALEKMAGAIALSGQSYQVSFSVQPDELSLGGWDTADTSKFERGLRALHTMQATIRTMTERKNQLHQLNEQSEQILQSNLQTMKQLRAQTAENAMEQEEQRRRLQTYRSENDRLEAEKQQRLETIATAEKRIQQLNQLSFALAQALNRAIRGLWQEKYQDFIFNDDFFTALVSNFEWFSFEIIERRLLELKKAKDPRSLGKSRNGYFLFEFAIEKQSCALVYEVQQELHILAIQRPFLPKDVGMSDPQLIDTLVEYGVMKKKAAAEPVKTEENVKSASAHDLIQEMSEQIQKGQKTIDELNRRVDLLALEKKTIELEKKSLFQEKEELERQLASLQRKIQQEKRQNTEKLQAEEAKVKEKIAQLERLLAEKTEQMARLQKEYDQTYQKALLELEQQKKHTETLHETVSKNQKELSRLQKEYDALKNSSIDLTNQLNLSESSLKKVKSYLDQQKKENGDQRAKYEKLKSSSESMKHLITEQKQQMQEIEDHCAKLKKENQGIQGGIQIAEGKIAEQEKNIQQLKKSLAVHQAQLDSAEIVENYDIRKEFERAFAEASTEIDIISPWLGRFTREAPFYAMVEKALRRGVVIKIRYGFNEDRGGADLTRESLQRIMREGAFRTRDEWSVLNIHLLHQRFDSKYPGKILSCRQDSHAKLLMVDRAYYLIGSFNFLSYDGSTEGRGEISLRDENQSVLTDLYDRFFKFETNHPLWITEDDAYRRG